MDEFETLCKNYKPDIIVKHLAKINKINTNDKITIYATNDKITICATHQNMEKKLITENESDKSKKF